MQATEIRNRKTAEEIVQRIASANLNAVFILVYYWGGKSFFRTDNAPLVNDHLKDDDLFLYFIEECHKKGIKVYARFSNGQEGAIRSDGILNSFPHWQIENIRGEKVRWFDLGKKEVREFQLRLLTNLLKNYPVDGIQLDYIRFPSKDYCYCEECRLSFKNSYNLDPLDLHYTLPANFDIFSVPLLKPTRAKVIARFGNGIPALSLRENDSGWLLLFNWRIKESSMPFFLQTLKRAVEGRKRIYIPLPRRELTYEEEGFQEIIRELRGKGFDWKMIGEFTDINSADSLLLIPALQKMGRKPSKELEDFLNKGGKIVVTLGKRGLIESEECEEVLGIVGKGRSIKGWQIINVVEEHPLVPIFLYGPQRRRELLEEWTAFRKGLITSFVEEVYKKAKEVNRSLQVSAAVFYNKSASERVLQDWYSWLGKNIVDFVAPMAYVDDGRLGSALKEWKRFDPQLERIIPGLSIFQVKRGKEMPKSKEALKRQIEIIKKEGAKGFILFSLSFLTEELARELSKL